MKMGRSKIRRHSRKTTGNSLPISAANSFYSGYRMRHVGWQRMPSRSAITSVRTFARLIRWQLDHPNLKCQQCRTLYEQGDLADDQGRTIDRGGVPAPLFLCELCPTRLMPEPDAITEKANEVYAALAQWPYPEHPPDFTFIFRLMGLRVGSIESQEVWERLLDRLRIEAEYRQKRQGQAATNGHQPDQP